MQNEDRLSVLPHSSPQNLSSLRCYSDIITVFKFLEWQKTNALRYAKWFIAKFIITTFQHKKKNSNVCQTSNSRNSFPFNWSARVQDLLCWHERRCSRRDQGLLLAPFVDLNLLISLRKQKKTYHSWLDNNYVWAVQGGDGLADTNIGIFFIRTLVVFFMSPFSRYEFIWERSELCCIKKSLLWPWFL